MQMTTLLTHMLSLFVGLSVGVGLFIIYRNMIDEKKKSEAKKEANRILNKAKSQASRIEKESKSKAKDFENRARRNAESDIKKQKHIPYLEVHIQKYEKVPNRLESQNLFELFRHLFLFEVHQ